MISEIFWFVIGLGVGEEFPNFLPELKKYASKILFNIFGEIIKNIKEN